MRTFSKSYAPRNFPGYNGDCGEIEGVGVCWGPVRNSSLGMRCEGHRGALYKPEPVPPTPKELKAQAEATRREFQDRALKREIAYKWGYSIEDLETDLEENCPREWGPRQWDEWQEKRWFRPFMYGVGDIDRPKWMEEMSKPMLLFLHSAIGHFVDWDSRVPRHVTDAMRLLGAKVTRELQVRGLSKWPRGPYALTLKGSVPQEKGVFRSDRKSPFTKKEAAIRADLFTEEELRICYSLAAEVADFSCLDWGVRCADDAWYSAMSKEVERRGLKIDLGPLVEEIDIPLSSMIVEESGKKVIGYWANKQGREAFRGYPSPESYIDEGWDRGEKATVLRYLDQGHIGEPICYMGSSTCRICGESNGSKEYTDGTYRWPEGFAHYLLEHGVKPAQEFIDHVLRRPLL